jgi:hypothetical protein
MSKFTSVAIPFITLPDGTRILTDQQIEQEPYLLDFIARFPHCFERSHMAQFYIFREPPDEEAQEAKSESQTR